MPERSNPCLRCGAPAPDPARIQPLGIEMERIFSCTPTPLLIGWVPKAIPWECSSCGTPQFIDWEKATPEFRHRAIEARALGLTLNGDM